MIVQSDVAGDGGPRHFGPPGPWNLIGNYPRAACGVEIRSASWTLDLEQVTCEACKDSAQVTCEACKTAVVHAPSDALLLYVALTGMLHALEEAPWALSVGDDDPDPWCAMTEAEQELAGRISRKLREMFPEKGPSRGPPQAQ